MRERERERESPLVPSCDQMVLSLRNPYLAIAFTAFFFLFDYCFFPNTFEKVVLQ